MKKEILLATLAILFVAGCTQAGIEIPWITSPTVFSGGGLVITEFYADKPEIYSNRSGKISMTVTNKGGSSVPEDGAVAVLMGSAIKDDFSEDGGLYWTSRGTTDSIYQTMGKDMDPYDPIKDIPADEKTINWLLYSPEGIEAGTVRSDVFIGRLYYDYATTVNGNIWVYSESESQAAKSAERPLNQNSFTSTSGPVAVYVTAKPTNVVVSSGDDTFTLHIKISNVGGGTVYTPGLIDYSSATPDLSLDSETELNRVDVVITVPDDWTGWEDCEESDVELVKGEATLTCDITVPVPTTFESSQIKVETSYGYWTERTASVTVSGK